MSIAAASAPERTVRQRISDLLTPSVLSVLNHELPALGLARRGLRPVDFTGMRSWTTVYGSTAGPFGGVGGAAMTNFRITVIHSEDLMVAFARAEHRQGAPTLYGAARYDIRALEKTDLDFFSRVTAVRAD